jgi:hypothetical protein
MQKQQQQPRVGKKALEQNSSVCASVERATTAESFAF